MHVVVYKFFSLI